MEGPTRYERFIARYEQRQRERAARPVNPFRRIWMIITGIMLIIGGAIFGLVPGPGGSIVVLAGLFMLAGEFRRVAIALDRGEQFAAPRAVRFWRRIRRSPERRVKPRDDD